MNIMDDKNLATAGLLAGLIGVAMLIALIGPTAYNYGRYGSPDRPQSPASSPAESLDLGECKDAPEGERMIARWYGPYAEIPPKDDSDLEPSVELPYGPLLQESVGCTITYRAPDADTRRLIRLVPRGQGGQ